MQQFSPGGGRREQALARGQPSLQRHVTGQSLENKGLSNLSRKWSLCVPSFPQDSESSVEGGGRERARARGRGGVKWNTVLLARQDHNTLGLTKAMMIHFRFAQDWAQQHPIIAVLGWGEELVGPHHFQRIYRQWLLNVERHFLQLCSYWECDRAPVT